MSDKKYPSNLYLESAATEVEFAKRVSTEAVIVMAMELLALRKAREGWKLVPVEPTAAMYEAGDRQMATKQVWDAMLAAAPEVE